jgi:MFS family permease
MLGIVLIYWLGKYFYQLAEKYNQNKWLYAILGIVVYYVSQLLFGFLLGILNELFSWGINFDNFAINLLGIPVGLLASYLFYFLLEKVWERDVVIVKDSIYDIGKPEND